MKEAKINFPGYKVPKPIVKVRQPRYYKNKMRVLKKSDR